MPAHPFTFGARIITHKKPDEDGKTKLVAERFPPISDLPRGGADGGARGRPPIVDLPRKRRLGGKPPFYPFQIENALRLNAADSAYLSFTPASFGNRRTFSISVWKKYTAFPSTFVTTISNGSGNRFVFFTESDGTMRPRIDTNGNSRWRRYEPYIRDPSSWFHFLLVVDTTEASASDRAKLYINGVNVPTDNTVDIGQNNQLNIWGTSSHAIGRDQSSSSRHFDGYMAEFIHVNGSALSPTDFGEFKNGIWVPKRYTGGFPSDDVSFHLDFADAANLGKDVSGNGNDFTENNITSDDQVQDTPTDNWTTLSSIGFDNDATSAGAIEQAGLVVNNANSVNQDRGTANRIPASGKWYAEATFGTAREYVGVLRAYSSTKNAALVRANSADFIEEGTNISSPGTFNAGDVVGIAVNTDALTVQFYRNGSSFGSALSLNNADELVFGSLEGTTNRVTHEWNFGQLGFDYTPPAGFKALKSANLPKPEIINSGKYFNVVTYTGNGGTQSITGVGFKPDLVWIKDRDSAFNHGLYDVERGPSQTLFSNSSNTESTFSGVTSFDTDGFTVGSNNIANANGDEFVAWCFRKGVTPGFDIVGYTGDGNTSQTISHSLGAVPAVMIVKNRSNANDWMIYHHETVSDPETDFLRLNTTDVLTDNINIWNDTAPTSSGFTVGSSNLVNANGDNYIAYLWTEVPGFSRFGSYVGNGNSDGPFVWCGFRPAFVMFKDAETASSWSMYDTTRSPYNTVDERLEADTSDAEDGGNNQLDILSNGFKLRSPDTFTNDNGRRFIFMAFAENPFKYSNAR
jgi:hypothetical protein